MDENLEERKIEMAVKEKLNCGFSLKFIIRKLKAEMVGEGDP